MAAENIKKVGRCSIEKRKKLIHELIVERLAADYGVLMGAAKTAHEAATHEENMPDNKYDTLSLEASYVAQGQANRAQALKRTLQGYRALVLQDFPDSARIRLTALVKLEAEDGETKTVFIGPAEGGLKVTLADEEIMVITPASPLGVELIGKSTGDTVNIGKREFEIVEVC
jgi:transcription elongation GreA/GreB family factor